jgi:uncharacterized protein
MDEVYTSVRHFSELYRARQFTYKCRTRLNDPVLHRELNQIDPTSTIECMITIDELKKELPPMCEKFQIAYVDAFGSITRSEQKEDSDIDLIIEFSEPRRERISTRFFGFLHEVEDRFHRKVDLITEKSLRNPFLKEKVNQDRIRIYGS